MCNRRGHRGRSSVRAAEGEEEHCDSLGRRHCGVRLEELPHSVRLGLFFLDMTITTYVGRDLGRVLVRHSQAVGKEDVAVDGTMSQLSRNLWMIYRILVDIRCRCRRHSLELVEERHIRLRRLRRCRRRVEEEVVDIHIPAAEVCEEAHKVRIGCPFHGFPSVRLTDTAEGVGILAEAAAANSLAAAAGRRRGNLDRESSS
jgi:hypothetical protein